MSEMPSREEFEQYKSLRDRGEYRAAAQVLLPYKDNPKVRTLIRQLKAAHESGSSPQPKPLPKPKQGLGALKWVGIGLVALVVVAGLFVVVTLMQFNGNGDAERTDNVLMRAKMAGMCARVFIGDYENGDAFSEGCRQEVDAIMVLYSHEIKYCYDRTEGGNLEAQFIDCLVENDVQFSGVYMLGVPPKR